MTGTRTDLQLRFDHAAIWVEDMEKTATFLADIVGWKRHPMEIAVSSEDETTGGMEAVFIDGNGLWMELILPTSAGPGMDILREQGAGAIVEINFEPGNYEAVLDDMKARGIPMFNMDGSPLGEDGGVIKEGVVEEGEMENIGQRIAYWSTDLTRGTTVEIYELLKEDETNLLNVRDRTWVNEKPNPGSPRIDHVAILVEDLDSTAGFYTDVMGLRRHPMKIGIDSDSNTGVGGLDISFVDANGVWLELVQPTGPGPIMDLLKKKGDGYVAELIAEVDNLDDYYDQVKAKGVELVNIDGTPFQDGEKCFVLEPYGDKAAYFPKDVSCGMTIEVYERGPRDTSLMHKRDDSWEV